MLALARLWTWTGHLFVPTAFGWALFVQNGLSQQPPASGVIISRAYWGVLLSLVVGSVLVWTFALYVRRAKRELAAILVPPNTTFEDEHNRNSIISWGTTVVFLSILLAALVVFGSRYSESRIHRWEDQNPLGNTFQESRAAAFKVGCSDQPCFAVGQRVDKSKSPIFGVNEYILYVTDGGLVICALFLGAGITCLVSGWRKRPIHID